MATVTAEQPRTTALRRYGLILLLGWIVFGFGAWEYARIKMLPAWVAGPVAAAFLLEFPFYLLPGFPHVLFRLATDRSRVAALMIASGVVPYLVYSVPTGVFHLTAFLMLFLLVTVIASWYTRFSDSQPLHDAAFLILLAAIVLSRLFNRIYLEPIPGLHMEYLGHLMLIHLAAMSIIGLRGGTGAEFRFWPHRREWLAGIRWFALLIPVAAAIVWALRLFTWRPQPLGVPLAIATFFAMLWVVALSEEFFFRGLLQHWLEGWLGSGIAALIVASIVFGAAHLTFAHIFPNWRFSLVAAVLGVFYGLAWRETRTVQSSMVTHALVVTVWRVFLK